VSNDAVTDRSFLTGESDPVTALRAAVIRAGEVNLGAPFTLTATAVGEDTSLRQVARLVEQAENARNRYTSLADKAARVYAPVVHLLALVAFLGWVIFSGDVRFALNVAIAVLIITCPCALGLAVPAVSTAAIGKLYELGFLVKSGTALERLAEVDTVVFDKTGTLTQPKTTLQLAALSAQEKSVALALAQHSTHPVSRAIVQALVDVTPAPVSDISEVSGIGMTGSYHDKVVFLGRGKAGLVLEIDDRVLPLGQSEALRAGSETAVEGLTAQNLSLSLMSGDRPAAVEHVAKTLGISERTSEATPEQKHQWVTRQAATGHQVAMIGDGLNDTAALAAAHASVAPSTALDASRNAADVVLLRDSLEDLPRLFKIARMSSHLSRQNFAIATFYNLIAVPIALAGFATPLIAALAMSISSLTVLINALRVRMG
jgi:Cu2+-exporting ATPase